MPGKTIIGHDRGRVGNFFTGFEQSFGGLFKAALDDKDLEDEFEVFGTDEAVARALVGDELIGITRAFTEAFGAKRTELGFFDRSFVIKIETRADFFEPDAPGGKAFGPDMAKKFVREIQTVLKAVETAGRIADGVDVKVADVVPPEPEYTDDIVENDDGTFSVHGRTYKSRATAEAYLEHYG